jgi:hypothetical protein
MKKIGILIFLGAAILGVILNGFFSFGQVGQKFFNVSFNKKVKGSGNVVTESRDIRDFKGIDVSGVFQVEITAQKDFDIEIQADDNLLPLIKTEVRNGVLHLETEGRLSCDNGLKVRISAPDINQIDASGASKVNLSDLKSSELRVDTSGASKINLSGETAQLFVEVSGASSVDAENLKADMADVNTSGASRVSTFAVNDLRAHASGASKVVYAGSPKNIEKSSSGVSSIRER